ncbi:MAG: class I SAM-dependent methyltransferase [Pseudomonadota bacterium]
MILILDFTHPTGRGPKAEHLMQAQVDHPKTEIGEGSKVEKMPGHWLLARLGKRILRPGGREATAWLLSEARPGPSDDVVEFAPGLGITAREILARSPRSYAGIERDEGAAAVAARNIGTLGFENARIVQGDAARVPLPAGSASFVIGEAMLSMQPPQKKEAIVREAARLLRPGGRYALHELALRPGTSEEEKEIVQRELSSAIHVGVRIGTPEEWKALLESNGFVVRAQTTVPMRLLELDRLLDDEGLFGVARMAFNAIRTPGALARLRQMRRAFRSQRDRLCAICLVAERAAEV